MNKSLFIPAPFFMLRAAILPIEEYESMIAEENWIESLVDLYERNELLREAIFLASPSLYKALQKKPLKNPLKDGISLLNYVVRMTTRATPFGLFSFVSMGLFDKKTQIFIEQNKIHKKTRPDMAWVYNFIQKIHNNREGLYSLTLRINPLCEIIGPRIFLNYIFTENEDHIISEKESSIKLSKLTSVIFQLACKPIQVSHLLEKIQEIIPTVDKQKTIDVIHNLLSNQYLLSNLLPSLLSESPFDDFLISLPDSSKMDQITQGIKDYDEYPLGKGESALLALQSDMETIAKSKIPLQVDAFYAGIPPKLSQCIALKMVETTNFLWKISSIQSFASSLNTYHKKFIEKYGIQRIVPLNELLSEQQGLGSFLNYPSTMKQSNSILVKYLDTLLIQLWEQAVRDKKSHIVLTDLMVDQLFKITKTNKPDPCDALNSLDVFFKIFYESEKDLEENNVTLQYIQSAWQGTASIGRFLSVLDKETGEYIHNFIQTEEKLENNTIFVEPSYWPKLSRNANVAIQPCMRSYRLDTNANEYEENYLSLEDIYVGATHDRFYLTVKDGSLEVSALSGNLLSPFTAPIPFQFIREVSLARRKLLYPFSWGSLEDTATYLPRVSYKQSIISPSKWTIDGNIFEGKPVPTIIDNFTLWAQEWNLPEHFLIARGDQYLLHNRKHPAHLHQIASTLKKGEKIQFIEHIDFSLIKTNNGHHSYEIILPLLKNPIYAKKENSAFLQSYASVECKERWKLPGSEWLFVKFYTVQKLEECFLLEYLTSFFEYLSHKLGVNSWFFIRYNDPESHLRVRINIKNPQLLSEIIILIHQASTEWMSAGLIKNIVFASYEKELERYGGLALIEMTEQIFCADSLAMVYLLKNISSKDFSHQSVLHALSLLTFLKDFGLQKEEIIFILDSNDNDRKEIKSFRKYKNELITYIKELEDNEKNSVSSEIQVIKNAALIRAEAIKNFKKQVLALKPKDLFSIYSSLLHMHCNRLGCNQKAEKIACLYARESIMHLKNFHAYHAPIV